MTEWLKVPLSKSGVPATVPWVRIPLSPPAFIMETHNKRRLGWRHINYLMAVLIIIIDGYIAISPILPQFDLWWRKHHTAAVAGLPYKTRLAKNSPVEIQRAATPTDNRLVIPSLALNEHIYIGSGAYLVNLGVWARP